MIADTLLGILRECKTALAGGGNDNPRFEAEQIIKHVCGVSSAEIIMSPDLIVPQEKRDEIGGLISRRLSGEPLQYLLGEWEFYGLPFRVGQGVLIPRQDTETLAELAVSFAKEKRNSGFLAADLCAGSGCVGICAAKKADVPVRLLEISEDALAYLRENITLNGVGRLCEAVRADVLLDEAADVLPPLDMITANPPYLTRGDMQVLQAEVGHEPKIALYGGVDGLDFYRRLVPLWGGRLKAGGLLAVEIGMGQGRAVSEIFEENGFYAQSKKDLRGIIRVIYGYR